MHAYQLSLSSSKMNNKRVINSSTPPTLKMDKNAVQNETTSKIFRLL